VPGFIHLDGIDQSQVIDVDGDFRILDCADGLDHRILDGLCVCHDSSGRSCELIPWKWVPAVREEPHATYAMEASRTSRESDTYALLRALPIFRALAAAHPLWQAPL